ncbi:hypothetical protein [Wenxinia marina]|uniref:AAA+ family ATPase n=1 Tax=Wenxinia marina DSM 24838 TaxID=1123501 RepID=A0A0D0NK33_9RHOB|nr:hypothetical protein [Wenxinia marina]KIQ68670.1 hypothetical protein Wenmar_02941 [Wenxinia marina DSM 24838]GGL67805.1 hypothetical protein GCM10011392_22840 [Wenxinia marina]
MRHALALTALLLAPPALAQETPEDDGPGLMQQGADMFFRGLMSEMSPAVEDFRDFAEQAGPALRTFIDEMGDDFRTVIATVDDLSNYEGPEFLPNGDIIIRRRPDAPDWVPPALRDGEVEPGEEIDL